MINTLGLLEVGDKMAAIISVLQIEVQFKYIKQNF